MSDDLILTENATISVPDLIRVDTALSRYPIHRMANKGIISIRIHKKDTKGTTNLLWEVDYSNRYGQPGPLAYKLDTIVINRRIDEAGRPVPKVLRLGSLREIAQELDLGGGTTAVRNALRQNAFAGITAKISYKALDKTERTLEADFNRYSVIFTGERLPNGQKADAVYLIINDVYAEVLNNSVRRPLDYDYLRDLPPGPQRFYEIVSYEMLPAIKFSQRAKLPYSEFCMYSTMTRYFEFDQVKKQMYKIHQPHIKAGYLAKVEYEAAVDEEGQPDWNMFYIPGEAAKRQQLVFDFGVPYVRRERRKTVAPPPKTSTHEPKEMPELPLMPAKNPEINKARTLVQKFYKLRYGHDQEPTERETGEATNYLADGEVWATHLIEFAARQGKEGDGFPNEFGGVKKLVSQAREPYETKRKERDALALKKARHSHQEAHCVAYHAFLEELLGGKLQSSLPEAFTAFESQEKSVYVFHKARAEKSAISARVVDGYYTADARIRRLIKFIEENPKSGIPNFWQWDEKMNPNPFCAPNASI